jgi:hypothetical protein
VFLLAAAACGGAPASTTSPSSAPAPAPAASSTHDLIASLERTECHGFCPVYKVAIYRDGAVEYQGIRHVKLVGSAAGHIGHDQVAALEQLFQRHGYLGFQDSYTSHTVTDLPSIKTSYTPAGQPTKSVDHYRGDRSAPEALSEVETGIDQIVHIEQWIGTEDERRAAMGR